MARVNGIFNVTGSLQNVSFYTMKGSDKIYMRTKGGPSKRSVKKAPEFALLRKHQVEWKGCVRFSREFSWLLRSVYKMRDFNVSPVLNGMAKKIIKLDTEHEIGARTILISKSREIFEGFNLNRKFPFNTVFRTSLQVEIDKQEGKMLVKIPRIVTANDLYNVQRLPYFRLTFNLSHFHDIAFNPEMHGYEVDLGNQYLRSTEESTGWMSANDIIPEQTIELNLNKVILDEYMPRLTCMGSAGIEFGAVGPGGVIEPVKHACCAKILSVV
ncbi:MAG: hypothetical protein ACYC2P_01085 [Paludibacteraceae bacterium]